MTGTGSWLGGTNQCAGEGRIQQRKRWTMMLPGCFLWLLTSTVQDGTALAQAVELRQTIRQGNGPIKAVTFTANGHYLIWSHGPRLHRRSLQKGDDVNDRCRELVERLDAAEFDARQQAHVALQGYGTEIVPLLEASIANKRTSREAKQRASVLLDSIQHDFGFGHQRDVVSLASGSENPTLVASAGQDGRVLLWRPNLGRPIRTINAHDDGAWAVAFSPNRGEIATGGGDNLVRVWSLADGRNRFTLRGHRSPVHDVAFSPDGKLIASAGSFDKTVRIWSAAHGELLQSLPCKTEPMRLTFHPATHQLAAGGYGPTITLWNTRDWTSRHLETQTNGIRCLKYSRDGKWLAYGNGDQDLTLFHTETDATVATTGHRRGALSVAFARRLRLNSRGPISQVSRDRADENEPSMATGDSNGNVRLWQLVP